MFGVSVRLHGLPEQQRRRLAETTFALLCLATITMLGLLRIVEPLHGDPAFFTLGAMALAEGQRLYTDFWDIKQPGIFYFYMAAGQLFGFDEIGVHTFELLYWLIAAIVLTFVLRRDFVHRWLAVLVLTCTLVPYFAGATLQERTQLELLVAFPLLMLAVLLVHKGEDGFPLGPSLLLAGMLAGVVLVFKLALVVVVAGLFLGSIFGTWRDREGSTWQPTLMSWLREGLLFAAGTSIVLVAVALVFWNDGNLGGLLWTTFVAPQEMLDHGAAAPVSRLMSLLAGIGGAIAFLIPFIVLSFWLPDNPVHRRWRPYLVAWIASALLAILVQRISWYSYQGLILLAPVAMLAVHGIDKVLTFAAERLGCDWRMKFALLALMLAPALGSLLPESVRRLDHTVTALFGGPGAKEATYRERFPGDYGNAAEVADLVRPLAAGSPMYVIGNPQIYLMLGTRQAIAMHGWALEHSPPYELETLQAELQRARPPLVFVQRYYADLLAVKAKSLFAWLDEAYVVTARNESGTWYRASRTDHIADRCDENPKPAEC